MKRTRRPTPLGIEIKMALFQQNITVRELAKRINKSEATVCEVISGKNGSSKTRNLILKELNLYSHLQYVQDDSRDNDII